MVRWPELVPAQTEINDIFSPRTGAALVAAAGEPGHPRTDVCKGYQVPAGQTLTFTWMV